MAAGAAVFLVGVEELLGARAYKVFAPLLPKALFWDTLFLFDIIYIISVLKDPTQNDKQRKTALSFSV